ncbi:hybrid sensor histidine kinase/response regulator [Pararhodospirillum oryzae]|uniref:histidine kinase n=1 Tax=Pararhodospirillum oryzae TaxID=478448 RepID=A0A512H4D0_9PROT|nr:PAS domain-containing sensor histidine kinase [Pararhodospirillum oryzae]GEO80293.1 hybrid sensor histidine kinase/response regulator [Pararhodospirillum oryzae]
MSEGGLAREPVLWGVALGLAGAIAAGLWAALGDQALAGWAAAASGAVALGSLMALSRTLAMWRQRAASGEDAAALLDAEEGPRLLTDAYGVPRHANAQALALWGETGPLAWLEERLHGDMMAQDALDRLAEAARAGLREEVDLPLIDPGGLSGEPEWMRVLVTPGPERRTRLWSARDVTARRAIDEVLLREREELADFLFFLPAGLYSADTEGRLRYVNQALAQWLGRDPEAMVGMALPALTDGMPPEPDGAWAGRLRFLPVGDPPFDAEVRQSTYDDAGQLWTRSVVVRLPEGEGEGTGAGEGEGRRRRPWLFEDAPVGIALTDPEGAITECNTSFLAMVGRERDTVLDQPLAALASREDRAELAAQIARVLQGQVGRTQTDVRLIRGEREASVAMFLSAMTGRPGDPPDGVVAHLIDTTEQKNLEQQFAQAQKMQAMGQLAGGVAHDFNNLLTAMIGFSDLLLQRHGIGDPSFADLMQIRQNANRAANLVRQLLAFSRRQPLRPRLLNVTDALSELSHLLRRLLGERVTLRLAHGREPGYIRVDPGQFDQVIINLAVNARDAMPQGGTLTITTRHEVAESPVNHGTEAVPPGDYVIIEVSDTGAGISREHLGRLFEPFFTTKSEGTAGAGTGLGLSTVYGIVRQTEGYIFVESTLGEGATFTICLPRHEAPAEEAPPRRDAGRESAPLPTGDAGAVPGTADASARATGAGRRSGGDEDEEARDLSGRETILLVEDEDAVRVFGARALRNKGYTVLEARTGEGALDVLADGVRIDLLITDMVMPGMDGATLAQRVRAERPDLRIILISGYSEDVIRGDVVSQPDTYFLPKPFSLKALAEKVREVLA